MRIFFVAVVSLLFFASAVKAVAQTMLSLEKFTKVVAHELRTSEKVREVQLVAPLELKVTFLTDKGEVVIAFHLDNAYVEYRENPTDLADVVQHYADSLVASVIAPFVPDASKILPAVRSADYVSQLAAEIKDDVAVFAYEELAGDIVIAYVFDSETASMLAKVDTIERLGVSRSGLRELAISNLRASFKSANFRPRLAKNDHTALIGAGGAYQTSLLLLDEFWTAERFPFKGDIVVFVLARETMMVTGSEDDEGLKFARRFAEKEWPSLSYQISMIPLVRRNGTWEMFDK